MDGTFNEGLAAEVAAHLVGRADFTARFPELARAINAASVIGTACGIIEQVLERAVHELSAAGEVVTHDEVIEWIGTLAIAIKPEAARESAALIERARVAATEGPQ